MLKTPAIRVQRVDMDLVGRGSRFIFQVTVS
jgi:hypothetical protein